ncbi:MAG: serine/threonine-protein kinase [Pseudomonadota bacterium]|nr:serine/threonine-protein kinase [Pseudomonadota bacterium]
MTRRDVLNLLEPGALLGGALFQSLAMQAAQADRLARGTRLGAFRIVDELGHGGMGVVYRAERDDGAYQQQVAIKCVIDSGSVRSTEWFRRERQILAELKHPYIARLLDGGHHADGRLWLAMELIVGQRIDAHAVTLKLNVEARLRLFAEVIDAVHAAHARLLIHRDIKPSNVLVDADGRAKLLDFGIAAWIDDAEAARAYSPNWASPEQRAGEPVGPASDQYQLGLLLDTLLRAHSGDDRSVTTTSVRNAAHARGLEPEQWISLPRARRSDLIAILSKATDVTPSARYGSVAEFATDLQRWLGYRPVAARGGGLGYTFVCALRRHPWIAASVALVLVSGIAFTLLFNWRLSQQRDIAERERQRADQEAAEARAINRFLNEDLLSAADPYGANNKDAPIGEVVERAVPRVAERLGQQPRVAGAVYLTLGNVLVNLGRTEPARAALDRAIVLLARTDGAVSERTVEARILRAAVEEYAGHFDQNAALLGALRDNLNVLDARDLRVMKVDQYLAWSAFLLGRFAEAEAGYRDVLLRSADVPDFPALLRAKLFNGQGLALLRLNRNEEALSAAQQALAIWQRELVADHPDILQSMSTLGSALAGVERLHEAIAQLLHVHSVTRKRFGAMSYESWVVAHELGVVLMRADRPAIAIAYFEECVAAKAAALGKQNGSTINSIAWLGLAYLRSGRIDDAERSLLGVTLHETQNDFDTRIEIGLRRNIAELRLTQNRAGDALAQCERGEQLAQSLLDASHPLRASINACRGIALIALGRNVEGRPLLRTVQEPLRVAGSQAAVWAAKVTAALVGESP